MGHWFHDVMFAKRFEPQKRKHGSTRTEWKGHRFPIKDGISLADTMRCDFSVMRNPLFDMVRFEGAPIGKSVCIRMPQ